MKLRDLDGIFVECPADGAKRRVPARACVLHVLKKFKTQSAHDHRRVLYPSCRKCQTWQEQVRNALAARGVPVVVRKKRARRRK